MEVIGLAVIVILLALGMFFIVQFTLLKAPSTSAKVAGSRQLASEFLSTLLTSNAGCGGSSTFSKVLEEIPNEFTIVNCQNQPLRDYFTDTVQNQILKKTLDVWGYNYNMTVKFPNSGIDDIVINKGCLGTSQIEQSQYFIPTDLGKPITVTLNICY